MSNIYDWSENPDGNHDADDLVTWREGMMPGQVNNSARAMMKRIRDNAFDRLFARQPVVGASNLRVTLEEDFSDYVDGMIVRFRCPNDIGEVPDKALLCVTNIPADKRGNNGDGLPMVMLSWNRDEKGLRVKRITGDMFVSGAHITAVYSAIHHIWDDDAWEAEQKAEKHLKGDIMAILKTDAEWQKYADDPGVFFIYTDSNMAEIQRMIDGTVEDNIYGCTKFPVFDTDKFSDLVKIGIAKKNCEDGDESCEKDCYKIVQYTDENARIKNFTEKTLYDDGVTRLVPQGSNFYSADELNLALRYLLPEDKGSGYVDLDQAITEGKVDRNKINNNLCTRDTFTISTQGNYILRYTLSIPIKQDGGQSLSYVIPVIDNKIYLSGDALVAGPGIFNVTGYIGALSGAISTEFSLAPKENGEPHTIEFYCFPRSANFKSKPVQVLLTCGEVILRDRIYRFSARLETSIR